jgi:stage V sporulation protein D (sporulation-specific penicillin-binding protein)
MYRKYKKIQENIGWVVIFVWMLMLVLVIRYGWVQLIEGKSMAERLLNQTGEEKVMQSPRGAIVDRNGRELAVSMMTKSLYIDPNHVKDVDAMAADLASLLDLPEQKIKDDIAQGGGFIWVKRRLEPEEADAVKKLMKEQNYGDCLGFVDEAKRYYPNDMLAANVLGFVGTDDTGLDGIEQACDGLIKGAETSSFVLTDTKNRPIFDSIFSRKRYQGDRCKTIELTLDSTVQFIVEQALDKAMATTSPHAITAVVMDPRTGDVLAMASRPSYNPNKFADYNPELWKNKTVSFIYEPGSTFKAVVAAGALQEKVVTPNQVFVDPGYIMVSGRRIQNWSGESFGTVTFADVVKQSINTGFAQVGLHLGAEKMTKYAELFGFGQYTGIELPGEEKGILFDPQDMRDSDIATMAIGQSIAVTPLQLVTAMSAIANDGVLLKPHIIKDIKNADGTVYQETKREEVRRTIESATDKTLMGLLEQVVAGGGGTKAAVKGYRIAGKTGTAQKIRTDGAGYMDGRYIASFCGFAPVEDPQITVLVMIDDPSGGNFYGGQIAAPVAGEIFAQLFRYLHIEPSSDPFADMNKNQNASIGTAMLKPTWNGDTNSKVVVPDVKGKDTEQAEEALADAGLVLEQNGSGRAEQQSLPPNTLADSGTKVAVYFKPE